MHLLRRITNPRGRTLEALPRDVREAPGALVSVPHDQLVEYVSTLRQPRNTESPGPVEELAVSPDRAAELLGVSRDFFDKHIKHQIPVTYVGRRIIIPVAGLHGWLEKNSTTP